LGLSILSENADNKQIIKYLRDLSKRVSQIERTLKISPKSPIEPEEQESPLPTNISEKTDTLEFHIGEYWFAKTGIVVLAIGIAFLLTLPYQDLPPLLPSLFGYFLVLGIFALSYYWREAFSYISSYLVGSGMILLYFTTMRLHFFTISPAVTTKSLELILLLVVVVINFIISIRRKSVYLTSLSLTVGYTTAIAGGNSYFLFTVVTVMSMLAVYFKLKNNWHKLIIYGIILTYITHFIWFLNNPFLGNQITLVSSPNINILFVLLYVLVFSMGNLFRDKDLPEGNTVILSSFINSFGGYSLFLLLTITKFKEYFGIYHLVASSLFLILAILFWILQKSKYSTFFYSIIGYSALSIAIIAQFKEPDSIVWLSWQSLLVITTAIWFRSKFIIVANFIIFIVIFIAYLLTAEIVSIWSLSFGFVALVSARILNWRKDRLELKTELMRNSYLTTAFFLFPYSLYHLMPGAYVALSWVAITLLYYLLSLILKNKKYRWMAHLTLLLTVLYVFIVGLTKLEPVYRVISFLVLGIVLLALSLIYTRMRTRTSSERINKGKQN
jgi:hypothetical protein